MLKMALDRCAIGISSRAGRRHVLMLDMDGLRLPQVENIAFRLMAKHKLSHMHILGTRDGHHVVCFDTMTWMKAKGIMCTSGEDEMHHSFLRGHAVLRISGKYGSGRMMREPPAHIHTMVTPGNKPKGFSLAHEGIYSKLFGVPELPTSATIKYDGALDLVRYQTGD